MPLVTLLRRPLRYPLRRNNRPVDHRVDLTDVDFEGGFSEVGVDGGGESFVVFLEHAGELEEEVLAVGDGEGFAGGEGCAEGSVDLCG